MKLIDGHALAAQILAETKASLAGATPVVRVITVQPSLATNSYLRIKQESAHAAGMQLEELRLPDDANEAAIIDAVIAPGADAVIVQLPLPKELDLEKVLAAIPLSQDADVLSAAAYARFEAGEASALTPPVAQAVLEILSRAGSEVKEKKAVVVGRGKLVGKPCAALLMHLGADLTIIDRATEHPEEILRQADIIVSGAGRPHFITPDMVKEGAVLIDAGTSGTAGVVQGDFHPDCAAKASLFTPVPGGVGPVAVACLFSNTARLIASRKEVT